VAIAFTCASARRLSILTKSALLPTTSASTRAIFTGQRRFAIESTLRNQLVPARRARRFGQV